MQVKKKNCKNSSQVHVIKNTKISRRLPILGAVTGALVGDGAAQICHLEECLFSSTPALLLRDLA